MADIFISYKREDEQRVERLKRALAATGWTVWWDPDLFASPSFRNTIQQELDRARCVIVVWPKLSIEADWVLDEAGVAHQQRKLQPVVFDSVLPPLGFRQVQSIDFSKWNGNNASIEFGRLCAAVAEILRTPPPVPPPQPPRRLPFRLLAALGATAVIVGVVGWWWQFYSVHKDDYQVGVRFSGIDSGDIRELKGHLAGTGWRVVPSADEHTPEARGRNEVRYGDSKRAAELLAQQVTRLDLGAESVVAREAPTSRPSTLEVWLSRPEPIVAPPPISPPATVVPDGPSQLRVNVDLDAWGSRAPDQAYCMQRKNSDAAPGKFLIRCFKTEDTCRGVQRTDSGDRTPCVPTSGLHKSPLWQDPGRGGIQESWYKYADQEFPPPFPQFDAAGIEPARYKVTIWFAGSFDRNKDIIPLSQKLRAEGWDAQVPRPSGGGDRIRDAVGKREVRYSGSANEPAAKLLANTVNKLGVLSRPVSPAPSSGIEPRELQLWISPSPWVSDPPDEAFCFQGKNNNRFIVVCHKERWQCDRNRQEIGGPSSPTVSVPDPWWQGGGGRKTMSDCEESTGLLNSKLWKSAKQVSTDPPIWSQSSDQEFASPFPELGTR